MSETVVLAGAGGMLGGALDAILTREWTTATVVRLGRDALDARRPGAILDAIAACRPTLVLNAAAHTDVEAAEADPAPAWLANSELPAQLALAARRAGAGIVHLSSTGCYGAWKETPYDEHDEPRPTTMHHRSKLEGETRVRESGAEHLIVRTGWLFGGDAGHRKNFVFKRVLEAAGTHLMRSDPTQTGNPTWVVPLAHQILATWRAGLRGTFNIVAGGSASRLDYVREIVRLSGLPCTVEPSEGAFERRARVSHNEAATNARLDLLGLNQMGEWREQLSAYVAELKSAPSWPGARP